MKHGFCIFAQCNVKSVRNHEICKVYSSLVVRGVVSVAAVCPAVAQTANNQRPRLVVGLVVDQMRWDYLTRYADRYGEGGFKRLLREGYSCPQTFINYLPSVTAVGHASILQAVCRPLTE